MSFRFYIAFVFLMAYKVSASAQSLLEPNQPEQDACGALPICGNFTTPFVYNGYGNTQEQLWFSGGCGVNEIGSVWLKLKCATSGIVAFSLSSSSNFNNYFFSVYDISGAGCNITPLSIPIRCGGGGFPGAPTGTGTPSGLALVPSGNFQPAINANAGDEYLILIQNYNFNSNYATGFSIDFSGSTAIFQNGDFPNFSGIKNSCNKSQQITVRLIEPIVCNSIANNGSDFYLTPSTGSVSGAYGYNCTQTNTGDGYTQEVTVQFTAPLTPGNYWLHSRVGTDGNSLLDLCGGAMPSTDSIAFTVDPYSPVAFSGLDSPACMWLLVGLSHKVLCDSIAADGSDFQVVGPSTVLITAAGGTNCDVNGLVDTILIALGDPIKVDGVYYLQSKVGSDYNTIIDSCTGHQLPGDQISFIVNSYNGTLVAREDTVLCKADTVHLDVNNLSWMNPSYCGIDTSTYPNGCFSISREATGQPGTTHYGSYHGWDVFDNVPGYRKQMLFRASELQALGFRAGKITRLSWMVSDFSNIITSPAPSWWPAPFITYDDFTIKIGCTALTTIGSNQIMIPNLKTVYSTAGYTPVMGINEFLLDSSYSWDGVNNIVLEVCMKASQTVFYDTSVTYAIPYNNGATKLSTTTFLSTLSYVGSQPGSDGCSMNSSPSYYALYERPDTRFTICSPPLPAPGPYQWEPQGYILGNSSSSGVNAYPPFTTTFAVSTTDRFGCFLRDTALVRISELKASASPTDTAICLGDSIQINADAGTTPGFYNWIADKPLTLSCLTCNDPVASPLDSSFYTVIISDQLGCTDTLHVIVNVNPLPKVLVSPKDTTIKYGSEIIFKAVGADYYSWTPGSSLDYPFVSNPKAKPLDNTDYIVVGLSQLGCRNSDTASVKIDYRNNLFVPSVFSPNNDGVNDLFRVVNLSFQRIQEFRVFNRWGQVVFVAFDNKGWDGTFNGELQDIGAYQYMIKIGYPDGYSETYKGSVTLLR